MRQRGSSPFGRSRCHPSSSASASSSSSAALRSPISAPWILIAGHVALALPYIVQRLVADMRHLRLGILLQAAESFGASGSR
jgi:ABC-type spermidine/putrescine transport system permease subunit II